MSQRAGSGLSTALAIVLIAGPTLLYVSQAATRSVAWDTVALQTAAQTLEEGGNPYLREDLRKRGGGWLSSTFQPLVLRLASPVRLVPRDAIRWLVLALGAGALLVVTPLVEPRSRSFALALFCSGFAGWSSCLVTGNLVSLLEFVAVFLLLRGAERSSTVTPWLAVAVLAFLKLTPALFALPLFWWTWQCGDRRKLPVALAWSAALFLGLNLLSAAASGGHYLDFYRSALGLIAGQHSPIQETRSGTANPSPLLLAADCFRFGGPALGFAFVAGLCGLVWWVRGALRRPFLAAPEGLPFVLLVTTLGLHLKPYFFLPIACLVYFCTKRSDPRARLLVLLFFAAVPLCFFVAVVQVGPSADHFGGVLLQNYQTILLLLAIAILYPALAGRAAVAAGR